MSKRKVIVSPTAQSQYLKILEYLIKEWTEKVVQKFQDETDQKIGQVAEFPNSCPESKKRGFQGCN